MEPEDFERLWTSLVDRKYGKTGDPLDESEQMLFGLNLFAGGVPRSGMIGYFENSTGKEILDARSALRTLGLERPLKILDDAQRILMDGATLVPTDEQIEVVPRDLSEEEYEAYSEKLESKISSTEEEFEAIEDDLYDGIDRLIQIRGITAPG